MLGKLFQKQKRNRWAVDKLHNSIQNQALRPDFYFEGGVRDNFSGRFEMSALHASLLFRRLRLAGPAGRDLSQDCFDALFRSYDEALRDIGTGDLSVGKKIRKMGEAFYGRAKAYEEALAPGASPSLLDEALARNLGLDMGQASRFGRYVRLAEDTLRRHEDVQLLSGDVSWPRLVG